MCRRSSYIRPDRFTASRAFDGEVVAVALVEVRLRLVLLEFDLRLAIPARTTIDTLGRRNALLDYSHDMLLARLALSARARRGCFSGLNGSRSVVALAWTN